MNSTGRRALVTGGSRGIGRGIAEALGRDGFDVAVFYLGSEDEGRPVVGAIEARGRRAMSMAGDVRDPAAAASAVETVVHRWGGLDVLVNNAGIIRDQVIWKMTDDAWHDVLETNLTGMFHFCRAALPVMRKNQWGAIVNISSINGLRGKFGQTNYSAAKAGVVGLTKALAKEAARFHVTVNAVAPGMIDTEMYRSLPADAKEEAMREVLLGRVGTVAEVAELVSFLCSERARFITGEVIRVDGGQYI